MVLIVDTHALIWFLEGSDRLSAVALAQLSDATNSIVVPTIVLTEIRYLYARNRIVVNVDDVIQTTESDERFWIYPLDLSVVEAVPLGLDIHDGIICGTALVQQSTGGNQVKVITRDAAIRNAGVVETLW